MSAAILSTQLGSAQLGLAQLGQRGAASAGGGGGGGGTQTILPTGIASPRHFGTPVLAGPIIASGVAPRHAVGTPTVKTNQTILPDGVSSPAAVGSPAVKHVQVIAPSGIAGPHAVGEPTVSGGIQNILAYGFKSARVGTPSVSGGDQGLQVIVGGVPMQKYLQVLTCQIQSQTIGRWTAMFTLLDVPGGTFQPKVGMTVLIQEFGNKYFAGCLVDVIGTRATSTDFMSYACTATDKSGICDRRVVTVKTYSSTEDAADVIRDIVTNFLNGEGITTYSLPASLDSLGTDQTFNFVSVTRAFDTIASLIGCIWWVDVNGDLHFSPLDSLPAAPFSITETSRNWRDISVEQTLADYRNRQYAVSNLKTVPTGSGGISGVARTQSYTVPQAAAVARQFVYGAAVLDFPADAITSLKVNGTSFPVYSGTDPSTYNPTSPNYHQVWWWFPGEPYVTPPTSGAHVPMAGDTVEIQYITSANNAGVIAGEALTPTDTEENPLGTCGSGVFEAVEQVQDVSLVSDLQAIAQAILDRSGGIPTIVKFTTFDPGLAPGQLLHVDIPKIGVTDSDLMIVAISGTAQPVDLGRKCSFLWQIQANSNEDPGNWVKYFERLVHRTEQALPLDRYEELTLVQPSGALLSGGVTLGNPYLVKNTGPMLFLWAAATTPPVDQDLTITLMDGDVVVGSLTMPHTTSPNELVEFNYLPSAPQYVFRKDVLTAIASYAITGPSPAPVDGLTFVARWVY